MVAASSTQHVYALAADVAQGERGAALLLADLLEEQGECASAARARRDCGKPTWRLALVIAVMPPMDCIQLGMDTVKHAMGEGKPPLAGLPKLASATSGELEAAVRLLHKQTKVATNSEFRRACHTLAFSMQSVLQALDCQELGEHRRAAHLSRRCAAGSARVAKQARIMRREMVRRKATANEAYWLGEEALQTELAWQLQHTATVLNTLVRHS